mmetsp:Transcript_83275/g.131451  ORF Transcript_83275/g.131451 Transcript_83275/m.131451 type:complete len:80 (+) Transcript_83275:673-912(+)
MNANNEMIYKTSSLTYEVFIEIWVHTRPTAIHISNNCSTSCIVPWLLDPIDHPYVLTQIAIDQTNIARRAIGDKTAVRQ